MKLDERFHGVLKDERFQPIQAKYDKYGRKLDKKSKEMEKFYHLSEDEEPELETPTSRLEFLNKLARGEEAGLDSSSEDSADDLDSEEETQYEDDGQAKEVEDIPMGEATSRFAVMNCDWSRIKPSDLLVLFQSFCSEGGTITNVTIYPSEYGLKKMAEEEKFGPQGLWTATGEAETKGEVEEEEEGIVEQDPSPTTTTPAISANSDSSSSHSSSEEEEEEEDPLGVQESHEQGENFDPMKLRQYEMQKLKYYYAIVTCDSIKTASLVVDHCDATEYETSSNTLDLRFVPEDMVFHEHHELSSTCSSIPSDYQPSDFVTTVLQQTEIKLTWEDGDEEREEKLTRFRDWNHMGDEAFSAYLGGHSSDSEEEEENEENEEKEGKSTQKDDEMKALQYKRLLYGSDSNDDESNDDESKVHMEMKYQPEAKADLLSKIRAHQTEAPTPWETYQSSKAEAKQLKRAEKRLKKKELDKADQAILRSRRTKVVDVENHNDENEEETQEEKTHHRDFNMKEIQRRDRYAEKKLKGKRKKKELARQTEGLQEGFEMNTHDPRFGALYEPQSEFSLDITDPKFKRTSGMDAILTERRQRLNDHQESLETASSGNDVQEKEGGQVPALVCAKPWQSLVSSVKRKVAVKTQTNNNSKRKKSHT